MEKLEKWLKNRPLVFSLLLALIVSYALGTNGVISEDAMPFGDGEHYALRGMMLYGYLHSGQWAQFWNLFTLPKQSLLLPHYLLFFLLPQAWASLTSYSVIQVVTTNVLLAYGAWKLCRALDREAWSPTLFLFCATQNVSLDESAFFFVDAPFFALGTVALAWQVHAWRDPNWRTGILSGVGAGLLFMLKPANAILFTGTYAMAELARIALVQFVPRWEPGTKPSRVSDIVRHVMALAAGFIPVIILALACGGFMSVFRVLDLNEVSGFFSSPLSCTGLMRLLYFPLCLALLYNTITLLVILAGAVAISYKMRPVSPTPPPASPVPPFPALRLIPLLIAYFILGEFFSFGMSSRAIRFLLIMLPVVWLAVFWALERWRVRPGLVFLAAGAYTLCGFSQILFDSYESRGSSTESYQLEDDWLTRFPMAHMNGNSGIVMTKSLLDMMQQVLPEGGKVAVGTEQLYLTSESLTWSAEHDLALRGQQSPYQFNNFITSDGQCARASLLGARGILIFVAPNLQYSRPVMAASVALVEYGFSTLTKNDLVKMVPIQPAGADPVGYLLVLKDPLTDDQVSEIIKAMRTTELSPKIDFGLSTDNRLTWQQCWDILVRWKEKKFGQNPP